MKNTESLWGGRFTESADESFFEFNRSFGFDQQLFKADIRGSIGHCRGLERAGVISADESNEIQNGLNAILAESSQNTEFFNDTSAEDLHSFIESKLIAAIGDTGRRLHTGRSRNDQVATALRIWMREAIDETLRCLHEIQGALVDLAEENQKAVLPGYTHLQRAQPVLFAHWCLAYFEMLRRDAARFRETRERVNVMPLGSAALAGTSYLIDREQVARDLGFANVSLNSLDAVSDRDFCLDFVYASSVAMMHLSRFAEDIILYCTSEFGFFTLSDRVSTGSSIMPQKKNPDSMELVRGKSGRVFGNLISLLTTMKGLPLAYNKDMQEDKEAVFDSFSTIRDAMVVSTLVIRNIELNTEKMISAAKTGYLNATELADYLVKKGVPFRKSHEVVGQIVLYAIEKQLEIEKLPLEELKGLAPEIEDDVYSVLSVDATVSSKASVGGTAPLKVAEALREARNHLTESRN